MKGLSLDPRAVTRRRSFCTTRRLRRIAASGRT